MQGWYHAGEEGAHDAWGNRNVQHVTGGTCDTFSQSADGNNRLGGPTYQYDTAGNLISDGVHSYTYDGENRLVAVDGGTTATYAYNANGQRVQKTVGGVTTQYLYDQSGKVMAEVGPSNAWNSVFLYMGNSLAAEYSNGETYFVSTDNLGSTRLVTEYPTPGIAECDDYYPYGELISCGANTTTAFKFTGKERDSESGNDYFGARYYVSDAGRFLTPDWSAKADSVPYARLGYPQSLNLFAYVENNPLTRRDLDGHYWCDKAPGSLACQNENAYDSLHGILTDGSKNAIANSALSAQQQKDFTTAVEKSAGKANIDPNILVGIAQQESTLGANMNPNGLAKGLYGVEPGDMNQINRMFKLDITTSDLLSLTAGSMMKVSTGVASFLGHYADIFSSRTDPRGIDIAIGVWRVGIGNVRKALRNDNFWDYVAPNDRFKEKLSHYIDSVERYDH